MLLEDATGGDNFGRKIDNHKHHEIFEDTSCIKIHYIVILYIICLKSLKNIEGRLIKSEKKREAVSVNQIQNIKEKLFPNASLQERHDNITSLLLSLGIGMIDELVDQLDPLSKEFTILS